MKTLGWMTAALAASALTSCGTSGYRTSYPISYEQAEQRLLSRLKLDKSKLLRRPGQPRKDRLGPAVYADQRLQPYLGMRVYNSVVLHDYQKGEHLSFTASHGYEILGTGSQSVSFELKRIDGHSTAVEVDFSDKSLSLYFLPAWNPGARREQEIAREIFTDIP